MTPVRIQRKRTKGWKMPPNTVCVTRPSQWGNPFRVGGEYPIQDENGNGLGETTIKTAKEAVAAYRSWVEHFCCPQDFDKLRGKNLACYCPLDQPCHADVLLELANKSAAE